MEELIRRLAERAVREMNTRLESDVCQAVVAGIPFEDLCLIEQRGTGERAVGLTLEGYDPVRIFSWHGHRFEGSEDGCRVIVW